MPQAFCLIVDNRFVALALLFHLLGPATDRCYCFCCCCCYCYCCPGLGHDVNVMKLVSF